MGGRAGIFGGDYSTSVVKERSSKVERRVLVDEAVRKCGPAGAVPVLGVRAALEQQLRHLLGLLEPLCVEEAAHQGEGRVAGPGVGGVAGGGLLAALQHKLDKLDDVSDAGGAEQHLVQEAAGAGPRRRFWRLARLEAAQQGGEVGGLHLTIDVAGGRGHAGLGLGARAGAGVVTEPVVQQLAGGHLDTAVICNTGGLAGSSSYTWSVLTVAVFDDGGSLRVLVFVITG